MLFRLLSGFFNNNSLTVKNMIQLTWQSNHPKLIVTIYDHHGEIYAKIINKGEELFLPADIFPNGNYTYKLHNNRETFIEQNFIIKR